MAPKNKGVDNRRVSQALGATSNTERVITLALVVTNAAIWIYGTVLAVLSVWPGGP